MIHTDTTQNDLNNNLANSLNVLNLRVDELEGQPRLSRNNALGTLKENDVVSYIGSTIFLELRRGLPVIDHDTPAPHEGEMPYFSVTDDAWVGLDATGASEGDVITLDGDGLPTWAEQQGNVPDGTDAYSVTYWTGTAWAVNAGKQGEYTLEMNTTIPTWVKPRIQNSTVDGRMPYWDETTLGQWVDTNTPSADQVMTFDGTPKWADPSTVGTVPDGTNTHDMLYWTGTVWATVTGVSGDDYHLVIDGSTPEWVKADPLPATPTTGDILYYSGTAWVSLGIGNNDDYLVVVGGLPAWV